MINFNEKMNKILNLLLVFCIGFSLATFLYYSNFSIEKPFSFSVSGNVNTPSNWINENQIKIENNKITISIENASLSRYAATGSMKPVLDENSNGIRIVPESPEKIKLGDIVTFSKGSDLIVHRVIENGEDEKGKWFITKGDNSEISDGKIYFSDIKYVTIGVLW